MEEYNTQRDNNSDGPNSNSTGGSGPQNPSTGGSGPQNPSTGGSGSQGPSTGGSGPQGPSTGESNFSSNNPRSYLELIIIELYVFLASVVEIVIDCLWFF